MPDATIAIELPAGNSSGDQNLHLTVQNINGSPEYFFTLTGEYRGAPIQIDFNESTRSELLEMREMIDLILEV